jgi:flagellar protein FlaG
MIVKPVTASGKSLSFTNQAQLPPVQETVQKDVNAKKSVQAPSLVELSELATDVQKNMNIIYNVDLQFSVHKDSGRVMVTVTDEATGKVIREIPPSEFVKFAEKFDEMVGMIVDQKG